MAKEDITTLHDLSSSLYNHVLRCEGIGAAMVGLSQFSTNGDDPMFNGVDQLVRDLIVSARRILEASEDIERRDRTERQARVKPIEDKELLIRDILPEWRKDGAFEIDCVLAQAHMKRSHFTPTEIAETTDPRIIALAADASRWRRRLEAKQEAKAE